MKMSSKKVHPPQDRAEETTGENPDQVQGSTPAAAAELEVALAELQKQLAEFQSLAAEYKDGWQRSLA
jgi:hypothetical protein